MSCVVCSHLESGACHHAEGRDSLERGRAFFICIFHTDPKSDVYNYTQLIRIGNLGNGRLLSEYSRNIHGVPVRELIKR